MSHRDNPHLSPIALADPDTGDPIVVMRSTRTDGLAKLHARGQITDVQFRAGRAHQDAFETAQGGLRAIDYAAPYVDGRRPPDPSTDRHRKAFDQIKLAETVLGQDAAALVRAILVNGIDGSAGNGSLRLIGPNLKRLHRALVHPVP